MGNLYKALMVSYILDQVFTYDRNYNAVGTQWLKTMVFLRNRKKDKLDLYKEDTVI
jgi:hypothetical protein